MLELIIAALIQVTVLTSGSAPVKTDSTNTTIQSSSAPTATTNIGTSGWDDRN